MRPSRLDVCGALTVLLYNGWLYANTLHAQLVYDDTSAIVKNPDVTGGSAWSALLQHDFWGVDMHHRGSHKSYRPLTVASFRLNHALHGLQPFGYHLVNVVLHAVCSVLVLCVCRRVVFPRSIGMAYLCCALFSAHPIHTEAVAGVVGRADILASLFTLVVYLVGTTHQQQGAMPMHKHIAILLLAGCALLSKEYGILSLAIVAAHQVLINYGVRWRHVRSGEVFRQVSYFGMWRNVAALTAGLLAAVCARLWLMCWQAPVFSAADNPAAASSHWATRTLTFLYLPVAAAQLLVNPSVLSFDWSMDAIPLVSSILDARLLCCLLCYTALGATSYAILIRDKTIPSGHQSRSPSPDNNNNNNNCCAYKYAKLKRDPNNNYCRNRNSLQPRGDENIQGRHQQQRSTPTNVNTDLPTEDGDTDAQVLTGLLFLVIPYLPATNLLAYVGFTLAERLLYLPCFGFCILLTVVLARLHAFITTSTWRHTDKYSSFVVPAVILVLLAGWTHRTRQRNADWLTEEALYLSAVDVNPAKAWGNYGNVLAVRGRHADAVQAYNKALLARPAMADTLYNLGLSQQELGETAAAERSYRAAIRSRPQLAVAHLNLALLLWKTDRKQLAAQVFDECAGLEATHLKDPLSHGHSRVSCLYNQGRLLAEQHAYSRAVTLYQTALALATPTYPSLASVHNMLGEALARLDRHDEAQQQYLQALAIKPDHAPAHLTMAQLKAQLGHEDEALSWLLAAVRVAPDDAQVAYHLGQHLAQRQRHDEAIVQLGRAVQLSAGTIGTGEHAVHACTLLANEYRLTGDMSNAESTYAQCVQLAPDDASTRANYAAMLHLLGKYSQALVHYQHALTLKPDDRVVRDNLNKLNKALQK